MTIRIDQQTDYNAMFSGRKSEHCSNTARFASCRLIFGWSIASPK